MEVNPPAAAARAAARDRFFAALPRFAQVNVQVDQAGGDDQPARINISA